MIARTAIESLRKWAAKEERKPLILRGARQVGKTTLVTEFAKEFHTFLHLNLERSEHRRLFSDFTTVQDFLMSVSISLGKRLTGRTLLFIDEIQNSKEAVALLRYFYEEAPQLYVIAAGSLLESLIDVHISFPVGRVEYMMVRPCTFAEFLVASGEELCVEAIESLEIGKTLHERTMRLFRQYTMIGGMPEVVSQFSTQKDILALNSIYETLLTGYRDDVEKYASAGKGLGALRHILLNGWSYAAERITLANFAGSSYKSREIGEAFRTLSKAHLIELTYPTTGTGLPILQEPKRSPKLLWFDTGLVNYVAGLQVELIESKNIEDAWRGRIAEQIVAQELLAIDDRPSHHRDFWVRGTASGTSEVDFVIRHGNLLVPIEVKSGTNTKQKSLGVFMEHASHDIAIRISSQPYHVTQAKTASGKAYRFVNLPFYYTSRIHKILDSL